MMNKLYLKFLTSIILLGGSFIFAQTNPALEMAGPLSGIGRVSTYTATLQKNTNNPTGNTFSAYSNPTAVDVTMSVTQGYPSGVIMGLSTEPVFQLMNKFGSATNPNTDFTSYGSTSGTGINVANNFAFYVEGLTANLNGVSTGNGRHRVGALTITFSRPVNNPLVHFKGLGGRVNFSYTGEFTVTSILDDVSAQILSSTTLTKISGTNLDVVNGSKQINNPSIEPTSSIGTTNSGRGTVQFTGNNIKSVVLDLYLRGNGTSATDWGSGADAFTVGVSLGESDLQILKSVTPTAAIVGSNVVFNLTAKNNGASNNTNVSVNDLLPSGYTYVSHLASTGPSSYVPGTGVWTINNLNDGANATLAITATVKSTGNYTNSATISTASGILDPVTTNNTASATVTLADPCTFGAIPGTVTANDRDGDGINDVCDLDSDNDGILDAVEMYCDQTNIPNGTFPVSNAPATTPVYSKQLLFFDWSGVTLSNASPTATKSVVFNGVTYTATISNYSGVSDMAGNDILTYNGPSSMVGRYYNVNAATFKEAFYSSGATGTNTFDVKVTATNGGVEYPVNLVVYDAETTNASTVQKEQIIFTVKNNGTPFSLLEKTGTGTIGGTTDTVVNITGVGTNTVTYNETQDSNVNAFFVTTGYSPTITASAVMDIGSQQAVGFAVRLFCDTENDGIPNFLDLDSDNDGCPDAVEGSENVSIEQVWPLNLPIADANYANRGKIKVIYDGLTTNTQPNIVSKSTAALGVPQLVNNAGNNLNSVTNPSNLAGFADNTDVPGPTTADIGQGVGASTNAAINACICYNDPNTGTVGADTKHGITLLKRAGATPQPDNWPMERKSAFTALESNTKGFVITRMTTEEINALTGQSGMMVYDTNLKCLKLFDGAAWSCFNTPTCP